MEDKKLVMHRVHESLNAKMIPFAGYLMPVRYSSDKEEHLTVRNGVGIFDVSHMGRVLVRGPEAEALLDYLSTNIISGKKI